MWRLRIILTVALSTTLVLSAGGVAESLAPLDPVVTGRGNQWRGYANDTYVAYTNWTKRTGNIAYARPLAGGTKIRLNASGKRGITGGFDPGTNVVIYQQYARSSDLYFYDLDTGLRSKVPGANSRYWEWGPQISSTFVVYLRERYRRGSWYESLRVYERSGGTTRTLGTWKWGPNLIFTGSAGDRYVTYTLCNKKNCFAYLYDWQTNSAKRIPTASKKPQYAPVVDETNGVVYFSRSANTPCGRQVEIWRRPIPIDPADTATKIVGLPRGIDTGWESSLAANADTGQMDLYFERWLCAKETGDVYAARGVDAVT